MLFMVVSLMLVLLMAANHRRLRLTNFPFVTSPWCEITLGSLKNLCGSLPNLLLQLTTEHENGIVLDTSDSTNIVVDFARN